MAASPPFAIKESDGAWSGLSVELWREIAAQLELRWEPREVELSEIGGLLRDGVVDAAIGAVAVTAEGAQAHDYSQAYFATGLGFAERTRREASWHGVLEALFSSQLLRLVGMIAAATVLVGIVIAILERRRQDTEFGGPLRNGIATGVWWAAVTMTTVGYGDATPKTASGRSLALLWMFIGVVAVAIFTATVTSILTVHSLQSSVRHAEDLYHLRLGAIHGGAGDDFLTERHVAFDGYETAAAALAALADGRIDAVVANSATLRHEVSRNWRGTLSVSPITLEPVSYAIGLPVNSQWRAPINRALLAIIDDERWRDVEREYLGH